MMFRCLLLSVAFCCLSVTVTAQDFLQGTEDVPLMSDFQISDDDTFSFDDDEEFGRLFFSKALTQNSTEDVLNFYNQTLPQMGWKKSEKGFFERDGDTLKIVVQPDDNDLNGVFFEFIAK